MPAVAVSQVSKRLGAHQALTDVSLDVSPGDAIVILGPSGCGKTTLLRLIAGLEVPDAGTISAFGARVAAPGQNLVPPHERALGFVVEVLAAPQRVVAVEADQGQPRLVSVVHARIGAWRRTPVPAC